MLQAIGWKTWTLKRGVLEVVAEEDRADMGQVLPVNFSHPITPEQSAQVATLAGVSVDEVRVVDILVQIGDGEIETQVAKLLDDVPISSGE